MYTDKNGNERWVAAALTKVSTEVMQFQGLDARARERVCAVIEHTIIRRSPLPALHISALFISVHPVVRVSVALKNPLDMLSV
jgi:hypothetical protein